MISDVAPDRQVVLLDLDGTLSASEPGICGTLRAALAAAGLPVPTDEELRTTIGPPFASGLPAIGVPAERVDEIALAYRAIYEETGLFDTCVYAGVAEMLDGLDALGCTLCIATSKPTRSARRVIEHLGFGERFKFVGGAVDDGRHDKAEVIGHVLDELGLIGGPELVMVGDRRYDVEGAAAHGIDTIGAAWGYGSIDELRGAGAFAIAEHPADVVALVAAR